MNLNYVFLQTAAIITEVALVNVIGIFVVIFAIIFTYLQWTSWYWKKRNVPYLEPIFPDCYNMSKLQTFSDNLSSMVQQAKSKGK